MIEAVYIHIPFCEQKCWYCDFLSFSSQLPEIKIRYVQALVEEIRLRAQQQPLKPRSIFIGGGTPTSLPIDLLEQVLIAVQVNLVTDALQEYTMEMNPGTVSQETLFMLKKYGINRLSMGVQNDQNDVLAQLGRIHTFEQVIQCYGWARQAGFDQINLDLIYGLPGQTLAQWQTTLERVMTLAPDHLSLYQLKIEENTVFDQWLKQGKIDEFDDELAYEMYQLAGKLLASQGYAQYEISNYAKVGKESIHNQVYWRTANYLGMGLGAHSFVHPVRYFNTDDWDDYWLPLECGVLPKQGTEFLTERQAMEEMVFMGLRMNSGVSLAAFAERYHQPLEQVFAEAIARCEQRGWLEIEDHWMRLTAQGRVLGNLVFIEFIE